MGPSLDRAYVPVMTGSTTFAVSRREATGRENLRIMRDHCEPVGLFF